MRTIWKYGFCPGKSISMPTGAKLLTVQTQDGNPQLWALVDPSGDDGFELRHIAVYATGHPMPDQPGVYIGTFQVSGGDLVFHVFEEKSA